MSPSSGIRTRAHGPTTSLWACARPPQAPPSASAQTTPVRILTSEGHAAPPSPPRRLRRKEPKKRQSRRRALSRRTVICCSTSHGTKWQGPAPPCSASATLQHSPVRIHSGTAGNSASVDGSLRDKSPRGPGARSMTPRVGGACPRGEDSESCGRTACRERLPARACPDPEPQPREPRGPRPRGDGCRRATAAGATAAPAACGDQMRRAPRQHTRAVLGGSEAARCQSCAHHLRCRREELLESLSSRERFSVAPDAVHVPERKNMRGSAGLSIKRVQANAVRLPSAPSCRRTYQ